MFPVGVYNVEDYPLNWIDGTYYSTYKGNTFQVSSIENVKSEAEYNAVTSIDLASQSLTTDFTLTLLEKFENLIELYIQNNTALTSLNIDSNTALDTLNTTDTALSFVSITNNVLLTSIRLHSQTEANFLTNLNDIITHGNSNGFLGYELDANTMEFDGLGQGVTLTSSISLTGDFTIEFILYYTASGHLFVDTTGSDRISISGSQIRFEISGANVSINAGLETSKVLRIRIERSGSDIDIYKDNVLQGSGTWANTQIINAFAKKRGAATTVPSLEGYLKDITIDDAGTVYYWAGDEGTGVTITESNQGNDGTFDGTWNGLLTDVTGLSQVQTLQSNGWTVVSYNQ